MISSNTWNIQYDKFLILSAWVGAVLYVFPGLVFFIGMVIFEIPTPYWIPVLILYAIGTVAHQLAYGFQALAIQVKVSADIIADELKAKPVGLITDA